MKNFSKIKYPLAIGSVLIFANAILRWFAIHEIVPGEFLQDAFFDSCIMPLQWQLKRPIWAGGTNYFVYILGNFLNESFGASSRIHQIASVLSIVICSFWGLFVVLRTSHLRDFENTSTYSRTYFLILILLLVHFPFIIHSIYTTAIAWSLGPTTVAVAYAITGLTNTRIIGFGIAGALGMFIYPGFSISILSLIFPVVVFSKGDSKEKAKNCVKLFLSFALSVIFLKFGFSLFIKNYRSHLQFAGGLLSFEHILEGLKVELLDLFYRSQSWNTFNQGRPYFETVLLWLWPAVFIVHRRLFWICTVALGMALLLGAMTWPYPGVRRIISVLLFIEAFLLLAIIKDATKSRFRFILWSFLMVFSFAWMAAQNFKTFQQSRFLTGKDLGIEELKQSLIEVTVSKTHLFMVRNAKDQFESNHHWCRLHYWFKKENPEVTINLFYGPAAHQAHNNKSTAFIVEKEMVPHWKSQNMSLIAETSHFLILDTPPK